jgi:very-short-patch-repair endonuclease
MECKICGSKCTSKTIGSHIRHYHHITSKEYYDHYLKTTGEGICKCGKPTEFISISNGYRTYCSKKCRANNINEIHEKTIQTKLQKYGDPNFNNLEKSKMTCLERYGVERAQSSETVRERIKNTWKEKSQEDIDKYSDSKRKMWAGKSIQDKQEMVRRVKKTKLQKYGDPNYNNPDKTKQTCLERYGVDNVFKSKDIQKRIRDRITELFGVEYPAQSQIIITRMKHTSILKYGTEYFFQTKEFKSKLTQSRIKNTILNNDDIVGHVVIDGEILYIYKCPHPECALCHDKFFISKAGHKKVRELQGTEICTNILPIQKDRISGTSIELFVRNILDENSIKYETNNRSVLNGKELDIYIPEHNLAIECNGIYWHSFKDKSYHHDKWLKSKEQGIQLLTIWEDQIIYKPNIIKNLILSKLGIYQTRIQARKCEVRNISPKESMDFLEHNHLQGSINGSIRIGLYHNNELMGLMVFGKKRKALGSKDEKDIWELYRYCSKNGVQVVAGASRLFKHFIKEHPEVKVETFSSNDISNGELYQNLGFKPIKDQSYSYWYIDKELHRHHRYTFRKDVLVKNGADPSKSEFEITTELGLFRIFDSGQQKWQY